MGGLSTYQTFRRCFNIFNTVICIAYMSLRFEHRLIGLAIGCSIDQFITFIWIIYLHSNSAWGVFHRGSIEQTDLRPLFIYFLTHLRIIFEIIWILLRSSFLNCIDIDLRYGDLIDEIGFLARRNLSVELLCGFILIIVKY
jgi:hypothetical protein